MPQRGQRVGRAFKQFESDFNISVPPPSRIWLDETGQYATPPTGYTAAQMPQLAPLATDSKAFLTKVWPRVNAQNGTGNLNPVDWNSDGTVGNSNVILEGEQCLVFFLGGAATPAARSSASPPTPPTR